MRREFRRHYTIRYDECNCYGVLTPAAFLRYMQEMASLDAEDAQLSGNGYWVARRSIVSFHQPVPVHTPLEMLTYGIGFTRITALRGYEARIAGTEASEPVISARTLWVYLDTRGRPSRLPPETVQIWLPDGQPPQPAEEPWPGLPEREPTISEGRVSFSDIDLMQHMNNAAYVEALDNAAWEVYQQADITPATATLQPLEYDIEYIESARLGENFAIETWFDPFPAPDKEFTRLQQIKRENTLLVRARSRWIWQTADREK